MQFTRLTSEQEVLDLIQWHNKNSNHVTLDTETTGLDRFKDTLLDVILCGRVANSSVIFSAEWARVLLSLRPTVLVLQNFKFDFTMLAGVGVDLRGKHRVVDTMLLHHLIDEEASHGLDDMVQERYGDDYKAAFWAKYKTYEEAPEEEKLEYACKDVIYTDLLYRDFLLDLEDRGIPNSLVSHVHALAEALYDTEFQGIRLDFAYLMDIGTELRPKIDEAKIAMRSEAEAAITAIENDLWALKMDKLKTPKGKERVVKPEFNWNSHEQLNNLIYNKLALPPQRKKSKSTKQWVLTTDDDALSQIEHLHPVIPRLRDYSTYQKVYTAFIEGTLEQAHNDRIYPTFNVNGTVTGRISSSHPNMQQLPSQGDWAKVRGIYIPDPDDYLLTCDYKQLEVVIAAHFSHDKNLLRIINEGASKHDITAASLGIERNKAKTLNFAMQYQCTPIKVAQILGCSQSDAQHAWNLYWEAYAGEKKVIDECKKRVDDGLPIINPFGRQRHFPKNFDGAWKKEAAYRQAYSSLIQGTGSDCTHWAFYSYANAVRERGYGRALFEVHDEIVTSVKKSTCAEAKNLLELKMVEAGTVANLSLPLQVDCSDFLERWEK